MRPPELLTNTHQVAALFYTPLLVLLAFYVRVILKNRQVHGSVPNQILYDLN